MGKEFPKRLTLGDEECQLINQTIEPFQRLEELDPQLVGYIMESLSELEYDRISHFYTIGSYRERRDEVYRHSRGFLGVGSFNFHDRTALKKGLLKMQSNVGLMVLWLGAGATYEDMKNQWPLPDQLSLNPA